jgi:hypothetical protein
VSGSDTSSEGEPPRFAQRLASLARRGRRALKANAYLGVVIACGLVLSRTVEFAPPPEVRVQSERGSGLVGDAPPQDFAEDLGNPQAVQLRATLRLYASAETRVSTPDPGIDETARVLSQPVVTTIIGMNATVEQTVRLEGGDLEVDLSLHATPRLIGKAKAGKAPPLSLDNEVLVGSRRRSWLGADQHRVHVDSRATLMDVEERGYRLVFTVDQHLFALDLELNRPYG